MSDAALEVAIPYWSDRHFPTKAIGEYAVNLERSGVVDYLQVWDQMTNWWPRSLWAPENTALATQLPDADSIQDAFIAGAYGTAASDSLGLLLSSDTARRGPAELLQTMLTLSDAVQGRAIFALGAGEQKQLKPFGWKRAEGLARMEDAFRLFRVLLEADAPIDFEGNVWRYEDAWIGGDRHSVPEIHALGGGPKLREVASKYADGFQTSTFAYDAPEKFAAEVTALRGLVEREGRDPDAFSFGIWSQILLVRDDEEHERMINNPMMKFLAATIGYLGDQADWRNFGFEPVMPSGWHYSMKLMPAGITPEEAQDIVDRTDPGMVEKCLLIGTPEQVAPRILEYADAGATLHSLSDVAPMFRAPEEAGEGAEMLIELARLLKAGRGDAAS